MATEIIEAVIDEVHWNEDCYAGHHLISQYLKDAYGISKLIKSRQLVKMICLILAKTERSDCAEGAPLNEVAVGMACINVPDYIEEQIHHSRWMKIYRFYSPAGEPLEIHLQLTFNAKHKDFISKLAWKYDL